MKGVAVSINEIKEDTRPKCRDGSDNLSSCLKSTEEMRR